MDAISDVENRSKNEFVKLKKSKEYNNIGNGIKSKNNTAKKIPIADLLLCKYNGTINLLRACHKLEKSLAQTASIKWSPLTILNLKSDSFTFFPNAPSSIISCFTPSCFPTDS